MSPELLNLLIGFGAGATIVFVVFRITLHDLQKRIGQLERSEKVRQDQINWLLISMGEVFNHNGWKERYSSELMRMLLLRDKGTPQSSGTIL